MRLANTIVCSFAMLTCTFGVRADDGPITIQNNDAVGDVAIIKDKTTMNIQLTIHTGVMPDQESKFSSFQNTVREEKTESVNKNNKQTNILRHYIEAKKSDSGINNGKLTTMSLEGNFIRIKQNGTGVVVTSSPKAITSEDKKDQETALHTSTGGLLPGHPVSIGDSWKPDPASLDIPKEIKVIMTNATLAEIKDDQSHKIARIRLETEFEMPLGDGMVMHVDLTGDINVALDIQRILDINLSGPTTMSKKETVNGIELSANAEGTLKLETHVEWKQIAGKPVPASK